MAFVFAGQLAADKFLYEYDFDTQIFCVLFLRLNFSRVLIKQKIPIDHRKISSEILELPLKWSLNIYNRNRFFGISVFVSSVEAFAIKFCLQGHQGIGKYALGPSV